MTELEFKENKKRPLVKWVLYYNGTVVANNNYACLYALVNKKLESAARLLKERNEAEVLLAQANANISALIRENQSLRDISK